MRSFVLSIVGVSFLLTLSISQSRAQTAATTLHVETSNNTSTSNAFRGMSNGNSPPSHVSKIPTRSLLYPGATTKIYARIVPFFLDSQKHVDVGYRSGDTRQVQRQVQDMISRGIDGVIVDWYGKKQPDLGRAAFAFRDEAERNPGFTFVFSEDKGALKHCTRDQGCDVNKRLIDDLNFAHDHFEKSKSYLRQNGRPVVFFFDVNLEPIDWPRVRDAVKGNPLFVLRNAKAFTMPESDGAFAWVDHTGKRNMPYLDDFYKKFSEVSGSRLIFGSVYKGFDDRAASWSENRVTDQECGQLWLDTFDKIDRHFGPSNPLDALEIVTWNDYEEGTEIESGIDNCVEIRPTITGRTLDWEVSGNLAAVDHFTVFASRDGENLTPLAQVPNRQHSIQLEESLPAGHYQIFVEAVGKPSVIDKFSPPVPFAVGKE